MLIDREDRRNRVTRELETGAAAVGGRLATLDQQSALHAEVPDLVEHPAVVTGTFPEEFLALPDEVLSTTMVHHQHYFPVVDEQGRLSAHFLAVTNTPGDDCRRAPTRAGPQCAYRPQLGARAGGPAARRALLLGRGSDAAPR